LYQETLGKFGIAAINDRFDMLRQLGNSFIVQPNVLKSYMTESHLDRIDAGLLRPYLAQRSDYSQFSRSLQLDDGPLESAHTPNLNSSSGSTLTPSLSVNRGSMIALKKGNRLSTMTGVAGVGMGKLKEMLKEFEALSPEEAALNEKRSREAKMRYLASIGKTGAGGSGAAGYPGGSAAAVPMYFGMH
jgi:hypothetical protein